MLVARTTRPRAAALPVAALTALFALVAAQPADAQSGSRSGTRTAARSAQQDSSAAAKTPRDRATVSTFGTKLSDHEAAALLVEMRQLVEQALAASRAAEQASSVAEVKAAADKVFTAVWGIPSGVNGERPAEVQVLGWKERFQVSGEEFDQRWVARYGSKPPQITDPRKLGIQGRGLAVRARLEQIADSTSGRPAAAREAASKALASLNNVIGWVHITRGYKGREAQPRASLTHVWDMPAQFWNSTADTGWLFEVYSQATNILKTDYAGDVAEARKHAADMTALLQKLLTGLDADRNGTIEPKAMEGGLDAALAQAALAGLPVK